MSRPGFSLPAVKDGDAVTFDRDRFRELWRRLKDGEYDITVEKRTKQRSRKANAYLWGCVYKLLSEHTGYTPDELHAWAKQEFLGVQTKRILLQDEAGEVKREANIPIDPTTTIMDTHDFTIFIESIRQAAAEIGCVIPDPDPEWMFNQKDAAA